VINAQGSWIGGILNQRGLEIRTQPFEIGTEIELVGEVVAEVDTKAPFAVELQVGAALGAAARGVLVDSGKGPFP
jgi:predicted RecB family endonuclease